jgi:MFS family permease
MAQRHGDYSSFIAPGQSSALSDTRQKVLTSFDRFRWALRMSVQAAAPSRSLWRHRDFMLLWGGETVSHVGTQVSLVALPLLAVITLAATPFQTGLLTSAETLAFLLVGLPAGAWLDRMRRRPVMLIADVVRGVLLLSVPLAWWAGVLTFAQLAVVALLVGLATVFFDVAYQSYLPSLVGRSLLVDGNGKLESTRSLAQIGGPALGGGLVQLLSATTAVVVDSISYFLSALALGAIRTREPGPEPVEHPRLRSQIAEGLRFVLRHPLLRPITACTGTSNFFSGVTAAVEVIFMARQLGLSAGVIGLLFSAGGIGGVFGALTSSWWARRVGQARTIWLVGVLTFPAALLVPLAEPGWRVSLIFISGLFVGYGVVVYNVAQVSFRQAITPDRLLGRMNASVRFLVWGTLPLGGFVGGVLGEWIGIRGTLWVAAIGHLLALLWVVASPLCTMRDLPQPSDDATAGRRRPI